MVHVATGFITDAPPQPEGDDAAHDAVLAQAVAILRARAWRWQQRERECFTAQDFGDCTTSRFDCQRAVDAIEASIRDESKRRAF